MQIPAEERVAEFASFSNGVSRRALGQALGLPSPTVVSAVRRLVTAGVLVEGDDETGRGDVGRPARLLRRAGPLPLLGLITWHHDRLHCTTATFSGDVVARSTVAAPTPITAAGELDDAVDELRRRAADVAGHRLTALVISVPAPLLSGGISSSEHRQQDPHAAFSVIATRSLSSELTERHGLPVFVENDANLAALGELRASSDPLNDLIYLKIDGYGFGGAVIANGALVRGAHGYAGELAHLQVDVEGPLCACGGRGCLRTRIRELVEHTAQAAYVEPISFADLPRMADAGDLGAVRMLRDIGRALGGPLAHLCTFLDPEAVVVDASLGRSINEVLTGIREAFVSSAPPVIGRHVAVIGSGLAEQAELLGALELPRESARSGRRR